MTGAYTDRPGKSLYSMYNREEMEKLYSAKNHHILSVTDRRLCLKNLFRDSHRSSRWEGANHPSKESREVRGIFSSY